jgi:hypothetical protein
VNATAPPAVVEDTPDLATMRETAHRLLAPDAGPDALPPVGEELATLTATLRGHIELLAPQVEQAAGRLPENAPTRLSAVGCAREARGKLRAPELSFAVLTGTVLYAQRLARVTLALVEHYETVSAAVTETPEQKAFVRLADHHLSCPTCKATDGGEVTLALACEEEERLDEEYRHAQACRRRSGRPLGVSA